MVRILGMGRRSSSKRRLKETAQTAESMRHEHALYKYALQEYSQTVQAGTSNDDGKWMQRHQAQRHAQHWTTTAAAPSTSGDYSTASSTSYVPPPPAPSAVPSSRTQSSSSVPQHQPPTTASTDHPGPLIPLSSSALGDVPHPPSTTSSGGGPATMVRTNPSTTTSSSTGSSSHHAAYPSSSSSNMIMMGLPHARLSSLHAEPALSRDYTNNNTNTIELDRVSSTATHSPRYYVKSPFEEGMVSGIVYEEWYGDAYTGAPIKYVYPKGYQSMRPRSGPWRLSILICLCFTWLSVFVVGHCSDRVMEDVEEFNDIDDDTLLMDIRWCGSRPLYLLWLASMLITGLSAAYCGVIGYIKCRDFAVANARAQPAPVSLDGTDNDYRVSRSFRTSQQQWTMDDPTNHNRPSVSDYYCTLEERAAALNAGGSGTRSSSIYQSDGTPQFWGSQIYRPTQAAVAVTSR